ncbi:formyl transferase [Maribacter sp. HTCC2170]|uniref:formyl transferase n=1 Tax=Maribacter sp. (strain HTCC2170 / KCCM 42371) TaxID=313603 RepID=UPI00006B4981|nr:formyl transferase [Maribacter sp. HTCC2170]EAR01086.1 formyl transferase domain protein [Maribacter sp. HTCC2170]
MKDTKIVLLTSNGEWGNIMYTYLQKNYTLIGVVLDSAPRGWAMKMIKRRIKKLGILKVFLQIIFQKGFVPLLNLEAKTRKNEILSELKIKSLSNYNDLYLPSSINDSLVIDHVNNLQPDVIMVCGTGIIKKHIIDGLKAPMINIHAGITPKYRGVHGGYWALANNDAKNCGVTVHLIDPGIDTGGVISQRTIIPNKNDNFCTYPFLQLLEGLHCVNEAILAIETNNLKIKPRVSESKLYYHPTITTYLYHRIFNKIK